MKGTHFSDIDSIKMAAMTDLKRSEKVPFKSVFNPGEDECTSVLKWKGITLKEFDFGIFQYFSMKFL